MTLATPAAPQQGVAFGAGRTRTATFASSGRNAKPRPAAGCPSDLRTAGRGASGSSTHPAVAAPANVQETTANAPSC